MVVFWAYGCSDANVCNSGWKRLQPHLQIFASWKTSFHLCDFFPLQSQNCCSWGCIEKSFRLQISTPNPPKKICSGGFGVRCSAPDGWFSCTKGAQCAMIYSRWGRGSAGTQLSFCLRSGRFAFILIFRWRVSVACQMNHEGMESRWVSRPPWG